MEKKKISNTKIKIKKAAIDLFNNEDTLSVTTNHIASHSKISPGNLYYHYKNKEDIILDIYLEMSSLFENLNSFELIASNSNPIKELSNMYDRYSKLFWDYRFLMRDSAVLIALYPKLKDAFLQRQEKRIKQIEFLIKFFIEKKIYKPMQEDEIVLRAKLNWFISAYWQVFASSTGEITKESIKEAKEIVFKTNIIPFLTAKGKRLLDS